MVDQKFTRVEVGERVDRPDFSHTAVESQLRSLSAVGQLLAGASSPPNRIIRGFEITASGTQLTITRGPGGCALLGLDFNGAVINSVPVASGEESRTLELASFSPPGTITAYIKAALIDSDFANRFKWNAAASTPAEIISNLATRSAIDWVATVSTTSPGPEWTPVATFTRSGGVIASVSDVRPMMFAQDGAGFLPLSGTWGSAADRADAGSTTDLNIFAKAVLSQISDIIDPTGQWTQDPQSGSTTTGIGPLSLATLNAAKFNRSLTQPLNGTALTWSPTNPQDSTTFQMNTNGTRTLNMLHNPDTGVAELTVFGRLALVSGSDNVVVRSGVTDDVILKTGSVSGGALIGAGSTSSRMYIPSGSAGSNGILLANTTLYPTKVVAQQIHLDTSRGVFFGRNLGANERGLLHILKFSNVVFPGPSAPGWGIGGVSGSSSFVEITSALSPPGSLSLTNTNAAILSFTRSSSYTATSGVNTVFQHEISLDHTTPNTITLRVAGSDGGQIAPSTVNPQFDILIGVFNTGRDSDPTFTAEDASLDGA